MGANFTPEFKSYSGQGAFRWWCQAVLPLVYDDSLSYMELLNKVVVYLNRTISDVAAVEENVDALLNSYNQLQQYVNDYFDNLDVQEEINNKLDGLVEDGTMDELLEPFVTAQIPGLVESGLPGVVGDQIDEVVADQIDDVVGEQIGGVIAEQMPEIVTDWLDDNVTPVGSAVIVDNSLTISGAAADAKVTGDKISDLNNALDEIRDIVNLYDPDKVIDAVINSSTGLISANSNAALVWCSCEANKTYTISKIAGTRFTVACSANIPTDGGTSTVLDNNSTASKLTVTTNGTAAYLLAYVYLSTTDTVTRQQMLDSVKINEGNNVIDYEVTAVDRKAREELNPILPISDTVVVRNDTILKGSVTVNANTYVSVAFITSGFVVGDYLYLYVFANNDTKFRPAIICYNSSNVQTGQCYNNDHGLWSYVAFRIPDNTTKIEIGVRNIDLVQATFTWYLTTNQLDFNHLYGKSVLAFGDSITFGANNKQGNVSKSYISIIAERNKMTLHNYAISGATYVKAYANADKDRYRGCIYDEVVSSLTNESADFPDIIILSGGLNDAANLYHDDDPDDPHPTPLGTFTANDFSGTYDTDTLLGAIEQCIYDLKQTFYWYVENANWIRVPKMVFTLDYYEVVTPTWTAYRAEIKKVCEKWGVPCIDMNDIIQVINANNMTLKSYVFTDGTHMDSKSQIIMANGIENVLKQIY